MMIIIIDNVKGEKMKKKIKELSYEERQKICCKSLMCINCPFYFYGFCLDSLLQQMDKFKNMHSELFEYIEKEVGVEDE